MNDLPQLLSNLLETSSKRQSSVARDAKVRRQYIHYLLNGGLIGRNTLPITNIAKVLEVDVNALYLSQGLLPPEVQALIREDYIKYSRVISDCVKNERE